jgi:hypothetical protein
VVQGRGNNEESKEEAEMLPLQLQLFGMQRFGNVSVPKIDCWLNDGDFVLVGEGKVIHSLSGTYSWILWILFWRSEFVD